MRRSLGCEIGSVCCVSGKRGGVWRVLNDPGGTWNEFGDANWIGNRRGATEMRMLADGTDTGKAQKPAEVALQLGSTAKQWSSQKGASLLSAAQAALPSISVSNAGFQDEEDSIGWRGGAARLPVDQVPRDRDAGDGATSGSISDGELVQAPEMDTDPVLEAFLKVQSRFGDLSFPCSLCGPILLVCVLLSPKAIEPAGLSCNH
jgi:hypothetical protein